MQLAQIGKAKKAAHELKRAIPVAARIFGTRIVNPPAVQALLRLDRPNRPAAARIRLFYSRKFLAARR